MSAAASVRTGRFYTAARRHPWVLGKVADWRIPLGPYTRAQILLAVTGGTLLVKVLSSCSHSPNRGRAMKVPIVGSSEAVRKPDVRPFVKR
ncbi:hypothetical protein [Streptomyces phaeochromogenes]|uniref:hypothetical protein n=1 Tax=Streptomyces phaeochromogenes TaxID=1923 RepID=UPI002DD7F6D5|nr:hypothetical protein [Streptomyces phaeochromogenes]WRZ36606.1 hypothetical protein OG931_00505 [Streptomyces phaeochromogenes]